MSSTRSHRSTLPLLALLLAAPAGAGVLTGNCRTATQPAATLLVPYFAVDLDHPNGRTTLVSVNNASAKPALARVVLWTDWGVPTLAFDVFLTGFDAQTLNVRDLFAGKLPVTGQAVSPVGPLSQAGTQFPGCAATSQSQLRRAAHAVDAGNQAHLRAAHSGQPLPAGGAAQCASSGGAGAGVATGYITVDAVNRCTPTTVATSENTPAQPGYFAHGGSGLASDENVLWGDVIHLDRAHNQAHSQAAVAIVADPDFFTPGAYTFYGRYVGFDGRDDRVPLSSLYYVRFIDGAPFSGGTDLVVWRDSRDSGASPQPCGSQPSWSHPGELQLIAFDEQENPTQIAHSDAFPFATQLVHVGGQAIPAVFPIGWLMLDLWHADSTHAQAWVGVTMSAAGRYSVGHEAARIDDLCNFGP